MLIAVCVVFVFKSLPDICFLTNFVYIEKYFK